jgi:hypothetical protein
MTKKNTNDVDIDARIGGLPKESLGMVAAEAYVRVLFSIPLDVVCSLPVVCTKQQLRKQKSQCLVIYVI